MKSPDVYQRVFEIQNGNFVDNSKSELLTPMQPESFLAIKKPVLY